MKFDEPAVVFKKLMDIFVGIEMGGCDNPLAQMFGITPAVSGPAIFHMTVDDIVRDFS